MKQYYYLEGNQQFGPFTLDELRGKPLTPETKVWTQGLPDWTEARLVPEINETLSGTQPLPATPIEPSAVPPAVNRPFQESYTPNQPLGSSMPKPKTWLVESILVTLFCCLPFGIAGIINASNVDTRYSNGDFAGAQRASEEAGKWTKIGFFVSIGLFVLWLALVFIGVLSGVTSSFY
ncbi:CD225/dispanin family protein [Larkinella sp. VNQ87]|uniref:CD225/dispanin family protein n=1 Tax=Larkinella sp. VNQ87 TaxID=3400921 RepID=UPI003C090A44